MGSSPAPEVKDYNLPPCGLLTSRKNRMASLTTLMTAPDIHVELLPRLCLRDGLEFTHHAKPTIVINDVNVTESNVRGPEKRV